MEKCSQQTRDGIEFFFEGFENKVHILGQQQVGINGFGRMQKTVRLQVMYVKKKLGFK
jgi:hypothetical protein